MTRIFPRITIDPGIRFGKPVIAGTRIPVEVILGKLAGGMATEEVMEEYALSRDDVQAALGYASAVISSEEIRATA